MATQSIKKAAFINILGKYSGVVINLIYSAILGRILSPQEFGVVAVILVFTTFFSLFANMGIGPAVIQNKTMNHNDNRSIFALTLYLGIIISILFSIMSYPISLFYDNSVYISIGLLLSISLFFNTLNIVPNALLLKEYKFKLVAYRTIFVGIISAVPTIYLATIGFSYYSIVIHSILVSIITFFWNSITSNTKIGLKVTMSSIKKIQEFSKYQFAFSLINYFSRNLDNLLIGRFIGDAQLGYYNRSYQLMQFPIQNLTHAITPVLHPILSVYQDRKDIIYEKYIKVLKVLSIIGIFVMVYTYFASREIMLIVFGNQWEGSVRSLQLLSLSVWAQMLASSSGSIFQSLNKTKMMMVSSALTAITLVTFIIIGIIFGDINSVALMVSTGYLISFVQIFFILVKYGFNQKYLVFIKQFLIDIVNGIILSVILYIIFSNIQIDNLILSAVFKLALAGVIYLFLLIITSQYKHIIYLVDLKKVMSIKFKKKNNEER